MQHEFNFPANSTPDATKIFVRLYPGPLSQVIEGMDSILRMPGGCFEQTSSSTYPNVLALDYMKHTKKLAPEAHAKAEGYIANGYQLLFTFEVPGDGLSWFGNAPANKILTSYGLMEFRDMSKVYEVEPKLILPTSSGSPPSNSRTEAGSLTRASSMKAPKTDKTLTCFVSPLTSRGRWKTPDTGGKLQKKPNSLLKRT